MKLDLLTAAFPSLSLEDVADWAAANGFEALEIACWPAAGAERRRYAGVSHIDVDRLDGAAPVEVCTASARNDCLDAPRGNPEHEPRSLNPEP